MSKALRVFLLFVLAAVLCGCGAFGWPDVSVNLFELGIAVAILALGYERAP